MFVRVHNKSTSPPDSIPCMEPEHAAGPGSRVQGLRTFSRPVGVGYPGYQNTLGRASAGVCLLKIVPAVD